MWTYEYHQAGSVDGFSDVIHVVNNGMRGLTLDLTNFGQRRCHPVDDLQILRNAFRVAEIVTAALNESFDPEQEFVADHALDDIVRRAIDEHVTLG